jgi:hypothetical protein
MDPYDDLEVTSGEGFVGEREREMTVRQITANGIWIRNALESDKISNHGYLVYRVQESVDAHHCHPIQLVRKAPRGAPQVTPIIDTVDT